jgi:hypothetical protein
MLFRETVAVYCENNTKHTNTVCGRERERERERESYITTDGQSASLSWCQAHIWGLRPDFYYFQTIEGLLMWGALSDEILHIRSQFVPHRKHITFPLQSPTG